MTNYDSEPFDNINSFLVDGYRPDSDYAISDANRYPDSGAQDSLVEGLQPVVAARSDLDIFSYTQTKSSLKDRLLQRKTIAVATLMALGIGGCSVIRASTSNDTSYDAEIAALAESNTEILDADIVAEVSSSDEAVGNGRGEPETPLFGTVMIDPKNLSLAEATTTTTTLPTTTTTIPSTTTTTTTTTTPPTTTTLAAPVETTSLPPVNPFANLNCEAESIVFEAGWTFSEVAANCGLSTETLRSYNPHISDINEIVTGITQVKLKPGVSSSANNTSQSSGSFNCSAAMGKWVEVRAGESQSEFLTRVITGYGYSKEQVDWMLEFKLVSKYGLTQGQWLSGVKRCAPTSEAIPILFNDIP